VKKEKGYVNSIMCFFLDKEHILIGDTNYTQPLQQRIALAVLRMHTAKKERRITKKKSSATAIYSL
jgi:hypothetical protein